MLTGWISPQSHPRLVMDAPKSPGAHACSLSHTGGSSWGVCVCVHVTQRAPLHLCHIPCGIAAYPSVSRPARQSELKMSSIARAFPAQADRQKDHPFICLPPNPNTHTHTHTQLSIFLPAPHPKIYNLKKAKSKVRTVFFLCFFKARFNISKFSGRNPSSN